MVNNADNKKMIAKRGRLMENKSVQEWPENRSIFQSYEAFSGQKLPLKPIEIKCIDSKSIIFVRSILKIDRIFQPIRISDLI